TSGGRHGLVQSGVHPSSPLIDQLRKRVNISIFELGNLAVIDDLLRQFILESEFFKDIHRCRYLARLCLAPNFKVELLKDLAKLGGRVDIELLSGEREDLTG